MFIFSRISQTNEDRTKFLTKEPLAHPRTADHVCEIPKKLNTNTNIVFEKMKDRKWEKTNLYKIAQTSEENWIFFPATSAICLQLESLLDLKLINFHMPW